MTTRSLGPAVALAAAALAAGAPTLAAAPVDTQVRVEGAAATLIPQSAIVVDDAGTETFFDEAFTPLEVPRDSAFFQLARATSAGGLALGWQVFDFGVPQSFVTRIGPDAGAGSLGWNFRVNGATPSAFAADQVRLATGDRVLWFYGSGAERTLDAAVSSDVVARGTAFTVAVTSRDSAGAPSPAAGALVRYGDAQQTADAQGRATFVGQAPGVREVQATRAGEIRSAGLRVCSYDADPTACNLPPLPALSPALPAPAPAAPASGTGVQAQADRTPPGSRITFPRPGRTHRAVRALRGVAGPDRSDLAGVEVALAQRVGTRCRFRGADGRFGPVGPCAAQRWATARSAGGAWLVGLKGRLPAATYRVWSRATDGAGNRERVGLAGVNTFAFRVAPPA